MKRTILLSIFATTFIALSAQTKTFNGGFFEIKYPPAFSAKGSLISQTAGDGSFDSAVFTSPDGEVEFYVYSPQWSGEPTDIALKNNEKEVSRKVKKGEKQTLTFWTIADKKGNYTRSYQETRNEIENTLWVIGIQYKNMKAYNKYKKQYLAFKASLVQYADGVDDSFSQLITEYPTQQLQQIWGKTEPQNVTDLFLLLPESAFKEVAKEIWK